jgi:Leu/Phe-tRNA-protein transferase
MLNEEKILQSMRKSVAKALAIKKALGQYAVVWDYTTNKVVKIPAKDLPEYPQKYINQDIQNG